jgi:hypothetical protein
VLASPALAANQDSATSAGNPMSGWKPPKVSNEKQDQQEIKALFQKMEQAGMKGDLEAAAALVDFPVFMVTDDSKGEASAATWDREKWTAVMKPFYAKPMHMKVTHKPTVSLLSDSLATVVDHATFTMGGRPVTTRSSTLVVRRGGEWKIKSMVEGGWGDMMAAQAQAGGTDTSATGTGSSQPSEEKKDDTEEKKDDKKE